MNQKEFDWSDDKAARELAEKINALSFKGCEKILCGDALYYILMTDQTKLSGKETIKYITRIFLRWCTQNNAYKVKGSPDTLFLFSHSYGDRQELKTNFEKVLKLVHNFVYMHPSPRRIQIKKLRLLRLPFIWDRQLAEIFRNRTQRYRMIYLLYCAYLDYYECCMFCKKHGIQLHKLVTNCDTHLTDSFFTQKFRNRKSAKTVTLQHGAFYARMDSWAYEKSHSDFCLVHGGYAMDEINKIPFFHTMIPAGLLSYIGWKEKPEPENYKAYRIGIFLDGGNFNYEHNVRLIQLMQQFKRKNNCRLYWKFHPTTNPADYEPHIRYEQDVYSNDILLEDFLEKIDAGIVSNSTVMMELIKSWIPAFIYVDDKQEYDMYTKFDVCRFYNEDELEGIICSINSENMKNYMKKARDYYCTAGDTAANYRKAFRKLGIY